MKKEILIKKNKLKKITKRKDFEIKFYEELIKKHPNFTSVLIPLGDAYTHKGFYQEGLAVDKKLARLLPNDPIVHYNFACSLSLVGRPSEALTELKEAVLLGYNEFSFMSKDTDLKKVRELSEFKSFFSKLKKLKDVTRS